MIYECNACADTENGDAPCILDFPEWMGKPELTVCPISGEEADWLEAKLTCQTCEDGSGWRGEAWCADCNDEGKKPKPNGCTGCEAEPTGSQQLCIACRENFKSKYKGKV